MALNRAMHFCCLSRFPFRLLLRWGWGTAGIRGWCASGEVDGSMDSKQVAVLLLLLLLDWGHSEEPGSRDGDQVFAVSEQPSPCPRTLSPPLKLVMDVPRLLGKWLLESFFSMSSPSHHRRKMRDPTHHSMPRLLGPSCVFCSRPWRDLAEAQPSCFILRGKFQQTEAGKAEG